MKSGGFLSRLGFTPNERIVIIFLLISLCIGSGIKLYYGVYVNGASPRLDYQSLDNEFKKKSHERSGSDSIYAASTVNSLSSSGVFRIKKQTPTPGSIDINSATRTQLLSLPGIGETIANRILLYRKEHGRFASNRELVNVKGIGEKKFLKLKPYLHQP